MIDICTRLSKKIKESFNNINKKMSKVVKEVPKNKENLNSGRMYFNGREIGPVGEIKIETQNDNEEGKTRLFANINKEFSGTFKLIIPAELKRIFNRDIDNARLFRILRKTKKHRTKKKLAKRILENWVLNELDKNHMMKRGNKHDN